MNFFLILLNNTQPCRYKKCQAGLQTAGSAQSDIFHKDVDENIQFKEEICNEN